MTTPKKPGIIPGSRLAGLAMSKDEVARACAQSILQSRRPKFPSASSAMREQGGVATARERAGLATETPAIDKTKPVPGVQIDAPNYHCRPDSALPNCPDMPPPPAHPAIVAERLETAFIEFLVRTGARAASTVTNAIVLVTPAIAHAWLKTNHNNRLPSSAKIARFAIAMKAGRWTLTGEAIKFDVAGELLDGQSRLRAILQSDTAVLLEVRWGLPRAAQESMDTGESRSHANQLQMAGVKYSSATAAALRIVWLWEQDSGAVSQVGRVSHAHRARITNTTIREAMERHPRLAESIQRYASSAQAHKLLPLSSVAAWHYIFATIDRAKADVFWDGLCSGANLTPGAPVYQLRERLVDNRMSQLRIGSREQAALIVKAWNAYYQGERLQRLAFRFKGDDPEAFPPIAGDVRMTAAGKAGAA